MATWVSCIRRNLAMGNPPEVKKNDDALRFGILGAAWIAPNALVLPGRSHPDVIVAAVAARDHDRAKSFAKTHAIPIVHTSYQELIDDPSIDAVYIPLPNSLHYEWALKSLKAGKHVLLEKPCASNAAEARSLFNHEIFMQPNAPVLLEACHSQFHPAFRTFLSLLDPPNIVHAYSGGALPTWYFPPNDIRFNYELSGGSLMDWGYYDTMVLRKMMGKEPLGCLEAIPTMMPKGYDHKCDRGFKAKWRFPNGGIGEIEGGHAGWEKSWFGTWSPKTPTAIATHREEMVKDGELKEGEEHVCVRKVTLVNYMLPTVWHRIEVEDLHTVRNGKDKSMIRTWSRKESLKAYIWPEQPEENRPPGEDWWSTYRYQLECFVEKVRGTQKEGFWIDGSDSIAQLEAIDSAYKKAGMPLRPSSTYQ